MHNIIHYFRGAPLSHRAGWTLLLSALMPLALSPFNLWLLAFIVPGLLFHLWLPIRNWKQALPLGLCMGIGLFGVGASWVYVSITTHGHLAPWLSAFITFLFAVLLSIFTTTKAVLFILFQRFFSTVLAKIWWFSVVWLLADYAQTWFLTGFPWLFIGNIATEITILKPLAAASGVFGVSFMIVLFSSLIWHLTALYVRSTTSSQKEVIHPLALLCALGLGISLLSTVQWTIPSKQNIQVGLVQANIPQEHKWSLGHRHEILRRHLHLTDQMPQNTLVVWPENAIPVLKHLAQAWLDQLEQDIQQKNSWLITGMPTQPTTDTLQNSLVLIGRDQGIFHKTHLVPFGEYVPLKFLIGGFFDFFRLPQSPFVEGSNDQQPLSIGTHTLAPTICYEITYPHLVAKLSKHSQAILTVSNDTWFGHSIGPHQHFQQARMRAIENQKPVIRSTNNGISGLIDANGQVHLQLPQFEMAHAHGSIVPHQGQTAFARYGIGSWIMLVFGVGLLVYLFSLTKRHSGHTR